jgi:predicted PurR-regulated permease PerM
MLTSGSIGVMSSLRRSGDRAASHRRSAPVPAASDAGAASGRPVATVPSASAAPDPGSRSLVRGRPESADVPPLLRAAAAWSWRVIAVVAAVLLLLLLVARLRVLALAFVAALFFTSLLRPLALRLRAAGAPRLLATWVSMLTALLVVGLVVAFVANRTGAEIPALRQSLGGGLGRVRDYLAGAPFNLDAKSLDRLGASVNSAVSQNREKITAGVLSGATLAGEVVTGLLLALFTTFFLVYDGERIWGWVVGLFSRGSQHHVREAGSRAWTALTGYVRGTVLVATFDAVFIGLSLLLIRVPLVVPLALLTFFAAFIPLAGATAAGAAAVLVALVAKGPFAALLVLAAVIAVQQIEAHVLQPLVLGRAVNLHPLAVVLAITTGAILAGIPGALVSVPIAAVVNAVTKYFVGVTRHSDAALAGSAQAGGGELAHPVGERDPRDETEAPAH